MVGGRLRGSLAGFVSQGCMGFVLLPVADRHIGLLGSRLGWVLSAMAVLMIARMLVMPRSTPAKASVGGDRPVAIIGRGTQFYRTIKQINEGSGAGFVVGAYLDLKNETPGGSRTDGGLRQIARYVANSYIQEVWIVLPMSEGDQIERCIDAFNQAWVKVRLFPEMSATLSQCFATVDLLGFKAIDVRTRCVPEGRKLAKEVFDRVLAGVALLLLSPALLLIAAAVRLSSEGPILFRQRRRGLNGKVFTIYKFRSMRLHAPKEGVVEQAKRKDARITAVGAFLRRCSLDELPQLINVLKGDMSLVGPRPHAIEHDTYYGSHVDGYMDRYRMKPGITGWAQINGFRGETDRMEKMVSRVEHDLYYMGNWSFWLDLKIVVLTVFKGFVGTHAY
jgi:Undecaprenyl-phosphate glucose phosphotransferase